MTNLTTKQTESDLTEAEAIAQAKNGVGVAFEYLYKAHCRRVYSLCLRMIKNPAEAEDLTQQAFLQLFRKISTFRGESGFSTWLHRVTVNIVLMHLRRKEPTEVLAGGLERRTSDGECPSEHGSSDTSMFGPIERLNLMRVIDKLPSGYKQVSCCMTSLDTSTTRSRDAWHARPVQNRNFKRPANDSGVYRKENTGERKPVSLPCRADSRRARPIAETLPMPRQRSSTRMSSDHELSDFRFGAHSGSRADDGLTETTREDGFRCSFPFRCEQRLRCKLSDHKPSQRRARCQ